MAAASDPGQPDFAVAQGLALALALARLYLPFAAAVSVRRPAPPAAASAVAVRNAPAAWNFSPEAFPAVPAQKARALLALVAPDSAAALRRHAAGNGNSDCAAPAAAPLADTGPRNISVGRQAAARAPERSCGPTGPIRCDAVATRCPSARPSVAAHPTATREST